MMKIRTIPLYFFAYLMAVNAQGQELQDLLTKTASLEGTNYWTARKAIVDKGKDIIPDLTKIQEDKTAEWKLQLMAGICKEWIDRKSDIEAMETKDWKSDPDYDPKWTRFRPGPWIELHYLVEKRLREKTLWFYCLEGMWKGIEKFPHIRGAEKDDWDAACEWAVEASPMRDTAIRILEDRVENDLLFTNKKTQRSFIRLIELKCSKSLPVLLKAWKVQGNMHDEFVIKIMNLAGPDDVDLLEEFMKDPNVKYSRSQGAFQDRVKNLKAARDAKKQKDVVPDKKDN